MDEKLTWKNHIASITTKTSRTLYAINRAKNHLPHFALKMLYISLIQSHLQYGISAWGNSSNIGHIVKLQKKALRIINNKPFRAHTEPLFKNNKLLKIEDIYKFNVLLFMHDYVHSRHKLPNSFVNFFPQKLPGRLTRQKLNIPQVKFRTKFSSKLTKHSFPTMWNNTDNNIQEIKSKKLFKLTLRTNFLEDYQATIPNCANPICRECYPT